MFGQHRLVFGVAGSMGVLSIAATSGLALLAHHFVNELSRPHALLDHALFTWKLPHPEPEPPASQRRSLLFHTSDGKLLSGDFWAQPHPAPTIVLCHGYRITRAYLRPVAALEYKHGYNILLFDFRGHGDSESVATSGGNAEVHDLEAALAVARQQPETLAGKIVIHGFSMGASIALLTSPRPGVAAIIADSPYARLDEILRQFVHWQLASVPSLHRLRGTFPALSWATLAVSKIIFRLRFGHALIARPAASFKRWQAQSKGATHQLCPPILLIHGVQDHSIPISHARQIAAQAQLHTIPVETYFVEEATHCGAYGHDPQEYIRVLQHFLARHLGSDFPRFPPKGRIGGEENEL
ncbi:MAG TPA: alpha/beta fold hydrolase [Ktedonobacteraceae bacterium]|nr:alpha/beta fold hydrolase [Ktedonobacteraceae bacterium]